MNVLCVCVFFFSFYVLVNSKINQCKSDPSRSQWNSIPSLLILKFDIGNILVTKFSKLDILISKIWKNVYLAHRQFFIKPFQMEYWYEILLLPSLFFRPPIYHLLPPLAYHNLSLIFLPRFEMNKYLEMKGSFILNMKRREILLCPLISNLKQMAFTNGGRREKRVDIKRKQKN